jgi:hypothetical protein
VPKSDREQLREKATLELHRTRRVRALRYHAPRRSRSRERGSRAGHNLTLSTIALIDTRLKIPGESIDTVVSTHETIRAAFKANEAFQKRMRDSGVKDHVPTKIVTLKVRLDELN